MNTALDNSNSKFSKVKEEFQRIFSIFMYSIDDLDNEFDTIKSHTKNEEDIEIIKELEKSTKKLEQNALAFTKGVGTPSKPKKEKTIKEKTQNNNFEFKTTNIKTKSIDKNSKEFER